MFLAPPPKNAGIVNDSLIPYRGEKHTYDKYHILLTFDLVCGMNMENILLDRNTKIWKNILTVVMLFGRMSS